MNAKFTAALSLAAVLLVGTVISVAPATDAYAAKAKAPKMNPKVLKPLKEALELANKNDFPAAEVELQKAEAVDNKSPFEQFQLDELSGFVSLKQQKFNDAAKAYERGLDSGLLPPEQVNDRLRLLSQIFLQTQPRNLAKSGEYGKRWLEATGTRDPLMLGLVGQSAYFGDNFQEAADYMKEAVDLTKAAGEKPEESWLLVEQSAFSKLNNNAATVDVTMDLVRYYPRKEHWAVLLQEQLTRAANKDRQIIQVFRLMDAVDAMDQADNFSEAAAVAIQRGFPGEAVHYLEKGYSSGVLENSGDKAKSKALLDEAHRLADTDRKSLPEFEKEAVAATVGEPDVKLGETYLSYDQPAKAVEAIKRGIAKGGVKNLDEAELALGRAYILTGNGPEAIKTFELVKSPDFAQLAKLWSIHASQL
ncbi:MAG: hypothetical protein R3F24_04470 [Gammaproteobacteria bacterium]